MQKNLTVVCEQQRCRVACASSQSDQHLCYSLPAENDIWPCFVENFNILASLWSWASWFEPLMVRPYKKIYVFLVTSLKILGRVGTHFFFSIFSGLGNSTRLLVFMNVSGCRASENFDISSENQFVPIYANNICDAVQTVYFKISRGLFFMEKIKFHAFWKVFRLSKCIIFFFSQKPEKNSRFHQ